MREWQKFFHVEEDLTISVNLSSKQFSQADLIEQVSSALRDTGLRPRAASSLRLPRAWSMENIDTAIDMLRQLRGLGIGLSIDDFGTGYSSLSYLHRFPIDTLKIDRSFVTRMSENNENAEIVRTIVTLARSLNMDVIAEGVESYDQLQQLSNLGCDYGQGYLFSKPVMAALAIEMLLKEEFTKQISGEAQDSERIRAA